MTDWNDTSSVIAYLEKDTQSIIKEDWGKPSFYRAFKAGFITQDQATKELLSWMEQQRFWNLFSDSKGGK